MPDPTPPGTPPAYRQRLDIDEQNRILELFAQGAPLVEVLPQLVRSVETHSLNGLKASILLLDADGQHLRHGAAPSLPDAYNTAIDGITIGPSVGSCGTAAYTGAPVVVTDIATDPLWVDFKDLAIEHGLRACWSTPIFSAAGEVLGTFAMYYDQPRAPDDADRRLVSFAARTAALLIERARSEATLAERERRFRATIDALPVAVYTTDADGWVTHYNPAAAEFAGRNPVVGEDRWCVTASLFDLDGTPLPHEQCAMAVALTERRPLENVEGFTERPDGSRVWFTAYPTPLLDADGRLVGGVNVVIDNTERRHAEELRARLAAIVESSDDAIISKDLNGVIMTWNAGAERLFGYPADEMIGQPVTILIPPERLDEEPEILGRIRSGERVDHYETIRRRKDGTLRDISLTVSPIVDANGRIVGASKIARDVTERRALERQRDAFIGIAAHELRTPVTGIKAYTQLLARRLRRAGDHASADTLDRLDAQADRLNDLIEDLLDVTRLDGGALPIHPAPFDLAELLAEVIDETQRTTSQHHIVAEIDAPVTLAGDRNRIGQVVTNLLVNAIKYSPHADRILVRASSDAENAVIAVQDFGIGIPIEDQPHVFDRFYRVNASDRASYSGLGLGLYIAAEFVKRHDGAIRVESEHGHGTTFTVTLPLAGPRNDRQE